MRIDPLTLIYFSPTYTTRRIIQAVAAGLGAEASLSIDLTLPEAAGRMFETAVGGLTVIGCPVYAGRVPAAMASRFRGVTGGGGPAVVLVVYGNRAYEDALLELRDLAASAGYRPIAAGAFIGEHSYSQEATPIATGRPDQDDLQEARAFGGKVRDKLRGMASLDGAAQLQVPGNFPYKELTLAAGIAPVTDAAACTGCGLCVACCPAGAIAVDDPTRADPDACIRCCACVKFCPEGAKTMDNDRINQFRQFLVQNHSAPKKPETYL